MIRLYGNSNLETVKLVGCFVTKDIEHNRIHYCNIICDVLV